MKFKVSHRQEVGLNPNKSKCFIQVVQEIWDLVRNWRISKCKPRMLSYVFWIPQLSISWLTFDLWVGFYKILTYSLKIIFRKSHWDELDDFTVNLLFRIIGTESNDLNSSAFENCIERKILRILFLCAFLGNSPSFPFMSSTQQVPISEVFHNCPQQPRMVEFTRIYLFSLIHFSKKTTKWKTV